MRIYVCLKHVPSVEAVSGRNAEYALSEADAWELNPLDAYAIALALQLGGEAVGICAGSLTAEQSLRFALSLGLERGILCAPLPLMADAGYTSLCLAETIKSDNPAGSWMVLCGRQSLDSAGMQVPYRLAARLGLPMAADVSDISLCGANIHALRALGQETLELPLPCLLAISRSLIDLPRPGMRTSLRARHATIPIVSPPLAISSPGPRLLTLQSAAEYRNCQMLQGAAPEAQAAALLNALPWLSNKP